MAQESGRNSGVVLIGGSFRKGVLVPIAVPERGWASGLGGWWGIAFLLKMREKGRGWGG